MGLILRLILDFDPVLTWHFLVTVDSFGLYYWRVIKLSLFKNIGRYIDLKLFHSGLFTSPLGYFKLL